LLPSTRCQSVDVPSGLVALDPARGPHDAEHARGQSPLRRRVVGSRLVGGDDDRDQLRQRAGYDRPVRPADRRHAEEGLVDL